MSESVKEALKRSIKQLPNSPGVYLFKDEHDVIIYIGKAKKLRSRVGSYIQQDNFDSKAFIIVQESVALEHIPTVTELEAMLLEARLIQNHQPKHNVIFKEGQPFLYILVTKTDMPEFLLVRNRKKKGIYFGPFIEKGSVRQVYDFLIKTFRLKRCHKKITGGCLFYHFGMCAGSCRDDFDQQAYLERIELAKKALAHGHKKFLAYLQDEIRKENSALAFEKSRQLHRYYEAFEKVFLSLDTDIQRSDDFARKDIWIASDNLQELFLFSEQDGVLKKKYAFYFPFVTQTQEDLWEHMLMYYYDVPPASTVLVNFPVTIEEQKNIEAFLQEWHKRASAPVIKHPEDGHYAGLVRMAVIMVTELKKQQISMPRMLKKLLELPHEPRSIDCFDVSHKQGMFIVGSCIRFIDGNPAPEYFRKFKLKTVHQNDDYASLREIVARRYDAQHDFPDLILIDGGKGQLNAVQDLWPSVDFISLAKREETVFSKRFMQGKVLNIKTRPAQVLIALRDYAHYFAISYHRKLAREALSE